MDTEAALQTIFTPGSGRQKAKAYKSIATARKKSHDGLPFEAAILLAAAKDAGKLHPHTKVASAALRFLAAAGEQAVPTWQWVWKADPPRAQQVFAQLVRAHAHSHKALDRLWLLEVLQHATPHQLPAPPDVFWEAVTKEFQEASSMRKATRWAAAALVWVNTTLELEDPPLDKLQHFARSVVSAGLRPGRRFEAVVRMLAVNVSALLGAHLKAVLNSGRAGNQPHGPTTLLAMVILEAAVGAARAGVEDGAPALLDPDLQRTLPDAKTLLWYVEKNLEPGGVVELATYAMFVFVNSVPFCPKLWLQFVFSSEALRKVGFWARAATSSKHVPIVIIQQAQQLLDVALRQSGPSWLGGTLAYARLELRAGAGEDDASAREADDSSSSSSWTGQ